MSNDLLREDLEALGDVDLSNDKFIQDTDGLYFANINKDKSVRILIDRLDGLSNDTYKEQYPNQHPYIDIMNQTTYGFCLSPRPNLDISCDGATSSVAFDLSQSRKYRIILDGQTIATAAKPSEIEALFSPRGIKSMYLAKPMVFNCASYTPAAKISIPIIINDTTSNFHLEVTDENGRVIVSNDISYNATNIGSASVTGIVSVSKLTGKAYLLNITVAAISSEIISRKWRFAITPKDNKSSLLAPSTYAANGYTGTQDFLPTYLEGAAYWCANVTQVQ